MYTANAIASSYGFDGLYADGDEGQGVTVAVYELESYDPADIDAFRSCYGIDASIRDVPVDGGAGSGPGSGEAALDIEQVIAFAPAHGCWSTPPRSPTGTARAPDRMTRCRRSSARTRHR